MERSALLGNSLAGFIPALVCVLCVLAANLPVSLLGGHLPPPLLPLMPVYFWGLVRPDLMTPALAFAAGLMEDLFSGGPPGVWGLSFVAAFALIDRQRDNFAGLSGAGAIFGFAIVMLAAALAAYGIVAIYDWRLPPVAMLFVDVGISVVYYIPMAFVLGFIHHRLIGAQRSDF